MNFNYFKFILKNSTVDKEITMMSNKNNNEEKEMLTK
jgi:hypothetical protein